MNGKHLFALLVAASLAAMSCQKSTCEEQSDDGSPHKMVQTIYVPSNWVFTAYQGNNAYIGETIDYSKFWENDSIIISARETDLTQECSKLFILKDYSAESIELEDITGQRVAEAIADSASGSVLRFKDISDSLKFGILKTGEGPGNKSVMISKSAVKDSIYVYEYSDKVPSIKQYAVFKVASAKHIAELEITCGKGDCKDTVINEGDALRVIVRENGLAVKKLPKAGFAEIDSVTRRKTDAFDFSMATGSGDSVYVFSAKAGDTTGTRKIYVSGDTLKVKVRAYDFSEGTLSVAKGGVGSITLNLGGTADTNCNRSNGFNFSGAVGLVIDSVVRGKVHIRAIKKASATFYATLNYFKNGVTVASCRVKVTDGTQAPCAEGNASEPAAAYGDAVSPKGKLKILR